MCRETGVELDGVGCVGDLVGFESLTKEGLDGCGEASGPGRSVLGQIVDVVDSFGGVGEVEVGGERADEVAGLADVDPAEKLG